MKNTLETRLGVFFALAFVAAAVVLEMVGGLAIFSGGYVVKARFGNILELKSGDPVKMSGKQIGRVDDIAFADDKLLVLLKITDRRAVVRTDSKATIKFSGLLGENYVAIDFGTPQGVPITVTGQEIQTREQADLGDLLGKLDGVATDIKKMTANLGELKLDEPIALVTDFLRENRPRIAAILTNTEAITAQVAAGKGTVGRLIREETLYTDAVTTLTNFNAAAQEVRTAVDEAKRLIEEVNGGQGTLGQLVRNDRLYTEVTTAATNLKEILQKINRGQGSVGKLVNDESLINNAKLTLQKLDKATEGLEDQGPLTILGILVNPLF